MSNSVLKNKDGQILDFKIPGYEIMKYNLEADSNPVRTGRKVNGKDEYVKRLIIPSFPNAQKKEYSTGITNATLVRHFVYMNNGADYYILLPYHSLAALNAGIITSAKSDASIVTIEAGTDRSKLSGFAEIYFTYNS